MNRNPLRVIGLVSIGLAFAICLASYLYNNAYVVYFAANNNDFKHIYLGAHAVRDGFNPYDYNNLVLLGQREEIGRLSRDGRASLNPYVYPPFTGLILVPLTWLRARSAAHAWMLANQCFFWISVALMLLGLRQGMRQREVGRSDINAVTLVLAILALCFAASFPMYRTLSAGQLTLLLMVLIAGVWFAETKGRSSIAVCLLAVAAMVKVTPGLLILYYVVRRDWKNVGIFALAMVLLLAASVGAVGWDIHMKYLPLLQQMGYGQSTWAEHNQSFYSDAWNQAVSGLWYRLLTDQSGNNVRSVGIMDSPALAKALSYLSALLLLGVTALLGHWWTRGKGTAAAESDRRGGFGFMIWLFPMLLCPSLMWDHYLILAFLPASVLVVEALRTRAWWVCLGIGISLVMMLTFFPHDAQQLKSGWATLLMNYKTYGFLLMFILSAIIMMRLSGPWPSEEAETGDA